MQIKTKGSGKTLAFLLPAVTDILANPIPKNSPKGPILLVISPTRELANQTNDVAVKLAKFCPKTISSVCLYGGVAKEPQMEILRRQNPSIVVATPGRLVDILDSEGTTLNNVRILVLDEADRMLDMGFEEQMRQIVKRLTKPHQTMLFSATWPRPVQKIAKDYLK